MNCIEPLMINKNLSISGMFIGCLPITSLRLSTLECFYDRICLDKVKLALNIQNSSIESLNQLETSRFLINTTLNEIIDELMIEEWIYSIDYDQYFQQCQIKQCTYSIRKRNNFLTIFTTLLSLCKLTETFSERKRKSKYFFLFVDGGLAIALHLIAPSIVKLLLKLLKIFRYRRIIQPQPFE